MTMNEADDLQRTIQGVVAEFCTQLDDPIPEYAVLNYIEEATEYERERGEERINALVSAGKLERTVDERLVRPEDVDQFTGGA